MKRRRHYTNPEGNIMTDLTKVIRNPADFLMQGLGGAAGALLTITIPNQFLPFPGPDVGSKILRALTRVAAGSLLYAGAKMIAPGEVARSVFTGSMIAAAGGLVLDMFGASITIGAGDSFQRLGLLSAYQRQDVTTGLSAYQRQMLTAGRLRGMYGSGSPGLVSHRLYG